MVGMMKTVMATPQIQAGERKGSEQEVKSETFGSFQVDIKGSAWKKPSSQQERMDRVVTVCPDFKYSSKKSL